LAGNGYFLLYEHVLERVEEINMEAETKKKAAAENNDLKKRERNE